ncbi:hypothetical protein [Magnetospirillum sp. 15-1]|uniref:hypothetical protein n=1 Tax=Magnetospirillum sp. 15-1 TaxID=1979370 RepID=UPI000BBC0750|nr:hypothetical protein [Magnetospirillum sp. 15-1]
MSDPDLRIAIVAEGPTDQVVIEAALKAILNRPFIPTPLQPESTRPDMGGGWGGVLKWCLEFRRSFGSVARDPLLDQFDMVIIHVDADVAGKSYADYGPNLELLAVKEALPPLPCQQPCPPPAASVMALRTVLMGWLGMANLDGKMVFCIPSKATEAWLASAVRPAVTPEMECDLSLETKLKMLPKALRIRKSVPEYQKHAAAIRSGWNHVVARCTQAEQFQQDVRSVV